MLRHTRQHRIYVLALTAGAVVIAACGVPDRATEPGPAATATIAAQAPQEPAYDRVQVVAHARWPTEYARSLRQMTDAYQTIVVATVQASEPLTDVKVGEFEYEQSPADGQAGGDVSEGPKKDATPNPAAWQPRGTRYSLLVERVISGDVEPGTTIFLGKDGVAIDNVAYIIEGDPLLVEGARYLFFLNENAFQGWYEGAPFGRFAIATDGRLEAPDMAWVKLGIVSELAGRTIAEAEAKIASAK